MRKFTEYISSQFGKPRGIVGKICCLIMNIINNRLYKKVISELNANENSNLLDIGYGNGYLVELLHKNFGSNIYGIDISADMKRIAEKRNRKAVAEGKMHLALGDCCDLAYEDSFFQSVTSINTVYFWEDTLQGLKEIHRVLNKNGIFYNVVYTKEWLQRTSYTRTGFKFFAPEDFLILGKEAGFSEVFIKDIEKGKSYIVIHRK